MAYLPRKVKMGLIDWIDTHPRTGWYLVLVVTIDLALNVLEVFH